MFTWEGQRSKLHPSTQKTKRFLTFYGSKIFVYYIVKVFLIVDFEILVLS
jgi:hypothetical protein